MFKYSIKKTPKYKTYILTHSLFCVSVKKYMSQFIKRRNMKKKIIYKCEPSKKCNKSYENSTIILYFFISFTWHLYIHT